MAVVKGKKITLFNDYRMAKVEKVQATFDGYKVEHADSDDATLLSHMLGSTGNLRAPTIKVGKNLLVGFNEPLYSIVLGSA